MTDHLLALSFLPACLLNTDYRSPTCLFVHNGLPAHPTDDPILTV